MKIFRHISNEKGGRRNETKWENCLFQKGVGILSVFWF